MSDLPLSASKDEIEGEVVFYSVLLDTLDPDADDFSDKKTEYEFILADLEARLQPHQDPQTPPPAPFENAPPNTTFNLPSRESRTGVSSAATTSSNSSSLIQKRPRESFSLNGTSKRSKHTGDVTDGSGASTPVSISSADWDDDLFMDGEPLKHFTSNRAYLLKKMREQEKQVEARIKLEQQDREMAKALSTQSSSNQDPSRSFNATQSHFQPNGHWQKPKLEPGVPQPSQLPPRSVAGPSQATVDTKDDSSGEDSDLQVITADQFTANVVQQPNHRPQPAAASSRDYARWASLLKPLPGSRTWTPDQQYLARQAPPEMLEYYASLGFPVPPNSLALQQQSRNLYNQQNFSQNPMSGGSSVYGQQQQQSAWQQAGDVLWNGISSLADTLTRGVTDHFAPSAGYPSMNEDFNIRARPAYSFEDDLNARGLNYMLADPSKTKEDLEALLANIRPDEDLPPEMRIGTPEQLKISLMEHQKLGLTWLQQQEASAHKGGILADDMGLGKTIQALALMVTRRSEDSACKTNLIIAPVSLLAQWKREIEQKVHAHSRLSVYIMHGQNTSKATYPLLSTYDVVITTYGTVASEFSRDLKFQIRRKSNPNTGRRSDETPVLLGERCKWYRVLLDEAQMIKNKNTKSAMGCRHLFANHRLCMTGTPMMNNVGEMYSLIAFLRISPFNDLNRFNREIKTPIESRYEEQKQRAMTKLQGVLKAILLRRTKTSKIDGNPILQLPERTDNIAHAVFDEDQLAFYKAIEDQVILQVSKYLQAGKIGRNYSYILVRLLRLRQACCHPLMIQDFAQDGPGNMTHEEMEQLVCSLSDEVVNRIKETNGQFECPICYDAVENPTIFFPCGHDSCLECFARITDPSRGVAAGEEQHGARCPECRAILDDKKVFDFKAFKKVYMSEPDAEAAAADNASDNDAEDEDDSDSDSDSSSDDEADSQGDLKDFIVPDDVSVDEETDEESENEHKPDSSKSKKLLVSSKVSRRSRSTKEKETKLPKKRKGKEKKKENTKKLAELRKEGIKSAKAKKKYLRYLRKNWVTSAKVEKVMQLLRDIYENDPDEKVIIFSQFSSLLDLLEVPVGDDGWRYCRYDGSMSAKDRNAAVEAFQDRRDIRLMLVSLKAGNAGLNLTAATQVIIMDPFWNPFIEEQAVDRAHRIGQTRPVTVHRVLIEDTVEDRIVALQDKKRSLINEALDEKAGQSLSRLGVRELRYLFGISDAVPS